MKNIVLLLFFPLLLLSSCSTPHYATPTESEDARICFGRGGGYTGQVSEFILLTNGQVFKKGEGKEPYSELKSVDKKTAKQAFSNYDFLKLANINFRHPGNLYYFIRYEHKGEQREIVWGNDTKKVSDDVKLFYTILTRMVKDTK